MSAPARPEPPDPRAVGQLVTMLLLTVICVFGATALGLHLAVEHARAHLAQAR